MRILVFGTDKLDCAARNSGVALRAMGHEVRHFDPDDHPAVLAPVRRSWNTRRVVDRLLHMASLDGGGLWERAFVREAAEWGPDLVLVVPIHIVSADAIAAVKRATGAKIAGWYQDAVVNMGRHLFLLAPYDALFFKDPFVVERFRSWGGFEHVHLLHEACEPRVHHPLPLTDEDRRRFGCDLMTYGNAYAYRLRLLEGLVDRDLRFYCTGPVRWHGSPLEARWQGRDVYFDDKIRAVLAAKIVLNTSHYGEVRSCNARTLEVAGIGGFQLADAPGVADLFVPGEEIVTFRGPKQLREAIDHYLHAPDERAAIAARGQARAHRDHTYEQRLGVVLATLGLAAAPGVAPSSAARA